MAPAGELRPRAPCPNTPRVGRPPSLSSRESAHGKWAVGRRKGKAEASRRLGSGAGQLLMAEADDGGGGMGRSRPGLRGRRRCLRSPVSRSVGEGKRNRRGR
ncbi:unnamed protein product [Urochloa humidicola]